MSGGVAHLDLSWSSDIEQANSERHVHEWASDRCVKNEDGPLCPPPSIRDCAPLLRELARHCHNGAGDPWQEFYDKGMSPLLDRLADAIERSAW